MKEEKTTKITNKKPLENTKNPHKKTQEIINKKQSGQKVKKIKY